MENVKREGITLYSLVFIYPIEFIDTKNMNG